MSNFLCNVTLLGDRKQSPDFPSKVLAGKLYLDNDDLIFSPDGRQNDTKIPLVNIDRCGADQDQADGIEGLMWALLFPLQILSLGLLSSTFTYVWLVYRNPRYGSSFEVWFKIGGIHHRPKADAVAQQIWDAIGSYRDDTFESTRPQRRRR